ncbi:MAG: acyl-CoA dehydrogenase [Candidatus Polarisedimenticolaceae bacterium]|nr:acyl-CoA dehydrogenase [Candidatus Polarisedimenticolaceae bacterium]
MTLSGLLLTVAVLWILAYIRAGTVSWIVIPPTLLITLGLSGLVCGIYLLIPLLIYLTAILFYAKPNLRKKFISGPLLNKFRKVMPSMSTTESEALEAGTVWWDGDLFSGKPDWEKMLKFPTPKLSDEEQAYIDGPVEEFCQLLDDWQITQQDFDLPEEAWAFLKQSKMFGLIIPKAYDGLEFSAMANSAVVMKIASRSVTAAVTVMVPNSLGPGKLLLHYGTQEQKNHYLPRLARGEEIPCFALTGPQAGSDAGALPDSGIICRGQFEGEEIIGIRLNWEKRYITLGPVSTIIGLAFKLFDPDNLIGDKKRLGITVALVPSNLPGVEIGERHIPLNIPFQNGPNQGKDVFIPMDWIIGGETGIGQGWRMLVECLSEGRGISLPALSVGAGKAACRYTGAYARVRRQFNQPIGYFEGIEEPLARIAGKTYQMDAARIMTLGCLDQGEKPSVISAIIKYHLTERYRQVINDAMDIQGGSGICLGPRNLIGRVYQAIPVAITVEGANILTRSMIIFGQGAIRCHPYVLKEFSAAQSDDHEQALEDFDQAIFGHIGFVLSNIARVSWLGLTRGKFSFSPVKGPTKPYFQQLNWMSAAFAIMVDVSLMTLGGSLKRKERISARLGDVLSELYLCSAVLKHYHDQGEKVEELPLVKWALLDSLYNIQEALRGLLLNLPFKPLSWFLRILIFPTWTPYHESSDHLDHQAARIILNKGDARERLTSGIYASLDESETVGRLERAFEAAIAASPLEKTLRQAKRAGQIKGKTISELAEHACELGIISKEDIALLQEANRLRNDAIQVDAFPQWEQKKEK